MNNVAGIIFLVSDLEVSKEFYSKLGFELMSEVEDVAIKVNLGGFWIELLNKNAVMTQVYKDDANGTTFGNGAYLQIGVEDINEFYNEVIKNGFEVQNEPKDFPWGNTEFTITDPDGYKPTFISPISKL